MLLMKIELAITASNGDSPHKNTLLAIKALHRVVDVATEADPALGGELRDDNGRRVGSYIVTFPDEEKKRCDL
jgi:hypothetical protein